MISKILVATHNDGKIAEYRELLATLSVSTVTLADLGLSANVAETGTTFAANATIKALFYAGRSGLLTLADDSGLEVDALNGQPGVRTARYGGADLSSQQRYRLLLEQLRDVPWPHRGARFRCVIALSDTDGHLLATAEGVCPGMIAVEPAGSGGFGYDPIFYLPQYGLTMAEVAPETKNSISHRARALRALAPQLLRILQQ